ncbi:MAG: GHKL domain-containing protein, partial [Firmicutes bacterium]|nr:GHKL domain-containing protein [Bacillota bacterium]
KRFTNTYITQVFEDTRGLIWIYTGKIRFNKDRLPVSREPGHGIGMPSIASTVQRYNGTLDIKTKDGIFSVSIMLYLKNKEHEKEGEIS